MDAMFDIDVHPWEIIDIFSSMKGDNDKCRNDGFIW